MLKINDRERYPTFFFLYDFLSRHIELIKITITGGHKQNTKNTISFPPLHCEKSLIFPQPFLFGSNPLMSLSSPLSSKFSTHLCAPNHTKLPPTTLIRWESPSRAGDYRFLWILNSREISALEVVDVSRLDGLVKKNLAQSQIQRFLENWRRFCL